MPPPQQGAGALPADPPGAALTTPALTTPGPTAPALPVPETAPRRRGVRGHLRAVPDVPLDFDAAVRALTPRLHRYAVRRLGDRHEAEELVQEALLRAYQHRAELATEDDLAAWTTCVTGRLVIDRLRVRGRSTPVADVPEGRRTARDTADVVVARDQARTALDALDAMPPRQAAVLWAREVEGLGYDAIGERFGMTEPAVRSLLTRARKALRQEYATRGGTLPGAGLALLAPWVTGTGWLERLRSGLDRAPAVAATAVVGAGLVTGAAVLPADPPSPDVVTAPLVAGTAPAAATAPRPASSPVDLPAATEPVVVVAAPAATPARPAPTPSPGPARPATPLERTGLDSTCVSVGSAGAGGADCAGAPPSRELVVDLPVDLSPLGVDLPALSTDRVPCRHLPALPSTRCTTPGDDS